MLHAVEGLGPDSCQIEFGVSLDAELGAVIAKTSATAHFTVTLTWTPTPPSAGTAIVPAGPEDS